MRESALSILMQMGSTPPHSKALNNFNQSVGLFHVGSKQLLETLDGLWAVLRKYNISNWGLSPMTSSDAETDLKSVIIIISKALMNCIKPYTKVPKAQ